MPKQEGVDEPIVKHKVSVTQALDTAQGDQSRIPRPSSHQIHDPDVTHDGPCPTRPGLRVPVTGALAVYTTHVDPFTDMRHPPGVG